MTALEAIRGALVPVTTKYGWPIEPTIYDGDSRYYITYNYADDRGEDFGDSAPGCNLASMQIHFFMPQRDGKKLLSYQGYKKEIREALFAADFTYPAVTVIPEHDADRQSDIWHICFECEFIEDL